MVMVVEAKSIASYLGLELVGGNVPIGGLRPAIRHPGGSRGVRQAV